MTNATAEEKLYNVPKFSNLKDLLYYSAEKYATRSAFQIREENGYRFITYKELKEYFYGLCNEFVKKGLLGKRIAVSGSNSFGWVLSYLCAATVGVAVPIDKELYGEDIKDFLNSAECSAICADSSIFEKLPENCTEQMLQYSFPNIEKTILPCSQEETQYIDSIKIPKDEMRVLIFTSGTTGNSKGVCLSQNNICANIHSTSSIVKVKAKDKTISILPLHHTYECTLNCLLLLSRGACISYCDGLMKIPDNLLEYKPSIMVAVPALLKVLCKKIRKEIAKGCPAKYRSIFEQKPLSEALSEVPFIIRKIISNKVKKSLGGNLRLFIVGAAELDTSLVDDFYALGIRTLQGYGLTECAPLLAGNNDFFMNPRSTGCSVPGVTLKIVNPNEFGIGEIAAKGENIMLGYYKDESATNAVMKDGFFHTGDLGYLDEKGSLFIKGRIKNVIVTGNGKNIYPEELETRLSETDIVSESLVFAANDKNGEVCVKAKILPNVDFIKEKLGHLPTSEEIHTFVITVIDDINSKLPNYKHIRVMEILEKGLERTTTQKIKRFGANLA